MASASRRSTRSAIFRTSGARSALTREPPTRWPGAAASRRGRSSMRSMFGPSESGRPSGSVRSGSSCISMKSASTPNATAARASGRNVLALAARSIAGAARQLHRVGRVEDDGIAEGAHDREAAHVDHEVMVAEGGAPLGEQDRAVAHREDLVDDVLHVAGRDELALLDVDRLSGLRDGQDEVGLPAEEGGNLQHVEHLGRRRHLGHLVDVREHRKAQRVAHLAQDAQPLAEPRSAVAVDRRAVGLVVRRLVDERHAPVRRDLRQSLGRHQRVLLVFDRARPADQHQRRARRRW